MHVDQAAMRPVLSRGLGLRGPKFYRAPPVHAAGCAAALPEPSTCDCGAQPRVLFVNYLDASTREGPREATTKDADDHPEAFARFLEADAAEQAGRPHPEGAPLAEEPFRPLLTWVDPEEGRPPRQRGPFERRRDEARARGETA